MKNTIKNKITEISALLVLLVLMLSTFFGAFTAPQITYADTTTNLALDKTNVLEDLQGSTIDGVAFDLTLYPFDETKSTDVFLLAEYCYSFYSNLQDNYSLYVYVYNPQGLSFDTASGFNTVEMSVGDTSDYIKYPLLFLNKSVKENYEGLFYKFKINLSSEQKKTILEKLNSSERFYHISGIELLQTGETSPKDWDVNSEYRYSGYSAGYGSLDGSSESTLSYTKSKGEVAIITSDYIGQTYYRPDGTNGTNNYTYNTLQTVYFSVPNTIAEKYGNLIEVRAEWLQVMTSWGLVTGGDDKYYDFFKKLVGIDISNSELEPDYLTYALLSTSVYDDGFGYNPDNGNVYDGYYSIPWLAYCFYAGSEDNSASSYGVSSRELLDWMKAYHDDYDNYSEKIIEVEGESVQEGLTPIYTYTHRTPYGGEYLTVEDVVYPYSKALFNEWDNEKTVADISVNDKKSLTEIKIDQTWWETLWGDYHETSSKTFDGIEAIKQVSDTDIKSTAYETCENLYINEDDYSDFKAFYDKSIEEERTVYLLRFDVGEYQALQVGQGVLDLDGVVTGIDGNSNAYIFRNTAYLGFDIIQLSYNDGEKTVTLGVVSNPFDVISGTTAPSYWQDNDGLDWWQIVIAVILVVLLLIFLQVTGILPVILKVIGFIILLPFRLIEWLIKGAKKLFNKKE